MPKWPNKPGKISDSIDKKGHRMTLLKELCPVLLGGGKKFWDVLSTFQIGTFTFFCPRIALSSSVGNIFPVSFVRFWVQVHRKKNPIFVKASRNCTEKSLMDIWQWLSYLFMRFLKEFARNWNTPQWVFLGKRLDRPKTCYKIIRFDQLPIILLVIINSVDMVSTMV